MAGKSYIPHAFDALLIWLNNLLPYVKENLARFGITPDDTTELNIATGLLADANAKADAPNAGKADRLDRKAKATNVIRIARMFVNMFLRYNPAVTDEDRINMGLNVPDSKPSPAPIPDTYPTCSIDSSVILRLTLQYRDSNSTSRAKPYGVHGCEIRWAILDAPPIDTDDLLRSEFSTHSPHTLEFKEHERGRVVFFRLCWENTRGQKGPWSEIYNAFVP
ncbi:MAG: hypothetical protein LBT83_08960 [Tannerella sp.]|jgi:hypothetical protein|nr:hypothetical protein [Tannerella sp.]